MEKTKFAALIATPSRSTGAGQARPGLNIFADISQEDFSRDYTCHDIVDDRRTAPPVKLRRGRTLPLPLTVNWRTTSCRGRPCIGPVKFQGTCGSCWAFAAPGALESHNTIREVRANNNTDPALQLSEQELVDCDKKSTGCEGPSTTS
ncbi:ervatamin-C-like [Panicum miliaceum]|uniref:Ervatamin-C-like n=1 Tax=Panicum miliaceum TaxID=4540 RepID=A0A3L6PZT3_PANMI|nr:ervatamin-C-like [Panicum miliaceum]